MSYRQHYKFFHKIIYGNQTEIECSRAKGPRDFVSLVVINTDLISLRSKWVSFISWIKRNYKNKRNNTEKKSHYLHSRCVKHETKKKTVYQLTIKEEKNVIELSHVRDR